MSEIRVGGQPLHSLLEGYHACFSYQFPIDNQNKFLMEVATEVKEAPARLLCLKIYKFYTDLLANANRLVTDAKQASIFEDKVYIHEERNRWFFRPADEFPPDLRGNQMC